MPLATTARLAQENAPIRPLGVGLPYIASLSQDLYRSGLLDFIEITPETLCRQRAGANGAIDLSPEQVELAKQTCGSLPMVVHGVELSIGSARSWNNAYLEMLDLFQESWPFLWHSEHLSFQTMPSGDGKTDVDIGVPLSLPATEEAVALVAERAIAIRKRYGVPFLLENPANYLTELPSDPEIEENGGLMGSITRRSGCFQLLDLHNIYCDAMNHGKDGHAMIDGMPLDRVVEIHVAGGSWRDGFWMDAHDGRVAEEVWNYLEYTLSRAPNVAAVVFELLEEHAVRLGSQAITEEISRAQTIWQGRRQAEMHVST